ncbi:MAG: ATP-binding cassette domain-containing protein [Pseudomonadota bacterium]
MRDLSLAPEAVPARQSPAAAPILEARGLGFDARGKTLLQDLNLAIRPGRRTVILGANGAGKSLTLRLLHGLLRPARGQVLWHGAPLDRRARRHQAMVFQRPVMLRRSVRGNLRFALKAAGISGAERSAREAEALALARLEDLSHRPARVLSGGEQQGLALARALATTPDLLFLDEPTASLDPASTQAVEALVQAAHLKGITIVMVTHDQGQARRLADDVIFLHAGRVAETGPASRLLVAPASDPAQAWLDGRLYVAPF